MKIKELLIQGAGAPMMYYFSDYTRVMAEGEVAQKAPATKISTNQGIKIGNLTVCELLTTNTLRVLESRAS